MKKVEIEWRPFPQEKPRVLDEYLVTIDYGFFKISSSAIWKNGRFIDNEEDQNRVGPVIAWAEMPEPYEEKA